MKVGKLKASIDNGEGSISLGSEFSNENALWKMDVLSDWIYDLEEEYEKAKLDLNGEMGEKWNIGRK